MLYTLLLTAAIIALIVYLALRFERKRSAALQAVATTLGATFRAQPTGEDKALLAQSQLGSLGHGRRVTNIMEAARTGEVSITLLDYVYQTGAGKYTQTWSQTVLHMQSPMLNLPQFMLYPETVFSKIAQAFGYSDIDFPEFPEFSKKYMVRGSDEAAVRRLFTPAIIQFCEQHPGTSLEGAIERLLFFRANKRAKPETITAFLEDGKRLMALFFEATRTAA
jgi:hypothetical protein